MKKFTLCLTLILMTFSLIIAQEDTESGFKPSGQLYGYAFGDMYYKLSSDTVLFGRGEFANDEQDDFAFTVRRTYFGYNYNISPNFSSTILLEGSDNIVTSGGHRTVFIKALYLKWDNLIPRASIFLGQSSTPSWSFVSEPVWGYRFVEKTLMDFRGLSTSNDFGIRITGKIDSDEIFGYSLMYANGTASKPENDKIKKGYAHFNAELFDKKIIADVGFEYEGSAVSFVEAPLDKSKTNLSGFIAYRGENLAAGVEGAYQIRQNYKTITDTLDVISYEDNYPMGISAWIKGTIIKDKLDFYIRTDIWNPDLDYKEEEDTNFPYEETFILAGLDWKPHKNVRISPNVWINTYKDKRSTSNPGYYSRTPDIVPRLTYYWRFQ